MTFCHRALYKPSAVVVASVIGLLFVGCGARRPDPVVTLGQGRLGVVLFQDAWTTTQPRAGDTSDPKTRYYLNYPEEFRLRKGRGSPTKELFLGVDSLGASSDNYFAVSVDGRFAVRTVSQQEWNGAAELTRPKPLLPVDPSKSTAFPVSGQVLKAVLPSPTQSFVAVLSYTGIGPKPQGNFLGGGDWRQGTMYLDVYDKAGRKVVAGLSKYSGESGALLLDLAEWIDEAVFIAPLDGLAQTCFLAILSVE